MSSTTDAVLRMLRRRGPGKGGLSRDLTQPEIDPNNIDLIPELQRAPDPGQGIGYDYPLTHPDQSAESAESTLPPAADSATPHPLDLQKAMTGDMPSSGRVSRLQDELDRLEGRGPTQPKQGIGRSLLSGLVESLPMIGAVASRQPGAVHGAAAGNVIGERQRYLRSEQDKTQLEKELEGERGREERQREAVVRGGIAQSQIEANTAFKRMADETANRRIDVTGEHYGQQYELGLQKQDLNEQIEASKSELRAAQTNEQASLAELHYAQNDPESPAYKLAYAKYQESVQKRQLAERSLQLRAQQQQRLGTQFGLRTMSNVEGSGPYQGYIPPGQPTQQGVPVGTEQQRETGPTTTMRTGAAIASTVPDSIHNLRGLVDQAQQAGVIGPAHGRFWNQLLAGKLGSTGDPEKDRLIGRLNMEGKLVSSRALQAHFPRGAVSAIGMFDKTMDITKMSPEQIQGALDITEQQMKTYASQGAQAVGGKGIAARSGPGGVGAGGGAGLGMQKEITATGPDGHKIVVRGGRWVDARTGQPVQAQ